MTAVTRQSFVTAELTTATLARRAGDPATAWQALQRAHIAGQLRFGLHWRVHVAMLGLGFRQRDVREVFGQLLRLALVPAGHALRKLPIGNHGRARVSPFQPMPIPPDLPTFTD